MNQSYKHIIDLETLLGYKLSKIDFSEVLDEPISYSWGDESELVTWLRHQDSQEQFGGNFYTLSGNTTIDLKARKKYPLIWLVPTKGKNEQDQIRFNNVRIVIGVNTQEEWLNSTRWQKKIPLLHGIADLIIRNLKGSLSITRNNGKLDFEYYNRPKYPVLDTGTNTSEAKAIDCWDAFVIDTSLIAKHSCKDEPYYMFCNT